MVLRALEKVRRILQSSLECHVLQAPYNGCNKAYEYAMVHNSKGLDSDYFSLHSCGTDILHKPMMKPSRFIWGSY